MAMKISSRSSALMLTATALLAISACGGSDASGQNDVPVSAYQKNAAIIGADGNYQMAPPPTPVKATTTTLPICGAAQTSAQKASAIIEAQLVSEGIAQVVAQSAASAAAASVEQAGLLVKSNCIPSPTTTSTSLVLTTAAPTTTATTISSVTTAATTAPSTTEFKGPNFTKPTTCSQINRKLGKC